MPNQQCTHQHPQHPAGSRMWPSATYGEQVCCWGPVWSHLRWKYSLLDQATLRLSPRLWGTLPPLHSLGFHVVQLWLKWWVFHILALSSRHLCWEHCLWLQFQLSSFFYTFQLLESRYWLTLSVFTRENKWGLPWCMKGQPNCLKVNQLGLDGI